MICIDQISSNACLTGLTARQLRKTLQELPSEEELWLSAMLRINIHRITQAHMNHMSQAHMSCTV